ncbi:class I SAM-dependent methyltransferase [candidate division KSB1 bacterium]
MNKDTFSFGKTARSYDQWFSTPLGSVYDKLEKRALGRCFPVASPGERLLDAGCGTGHFAVYLAERGYTIFGIDSAPEMITVARNKEIRGARFVVADILDIPFPDEHFDTVLTVTVLEFIEQPEKALQEMMRCLKSGGRLVIAVLNAFSPLSRKRKRQGSGTYKTANLFTPEKLEQLMMPLNDVEVKAAAFVLPYRGLVWSHIITEIPGARFNWKWGDFIVGKGIK